jgi:Protein of unknown function (DUF1552)
MKRRQFLRGLAGVSVGLPFLSSLERRSLRAAVAAPPKRFVTFFTGCGIDPSRFWPTSPWDSALTSTSFNGTALAPLSAFRQKLLIARGIRTSPRGYGRDGAQNSGAANDHNLGTAARLTSRSLSGSENYATGISVDQEMAKSLNPGGRAALTLGVGTHFGGADGNISYLSNGTPAAREGNPYAVYQLFMSPPTTTGGSNLLLTRRQSILDLVKTDMDELKASSRLGQDDRTKLDMHYTAIRDLEVAMTTANGPGCMLMGDSAADISTVNPNTLTANANFRMLGKLQMDVLALALACGYTNVATLMWGSGEGGPVFDWLGHSPEHHLISHQVVDYTSTTPLAGAADMLNQIDTWYAGQFAYLLAKLDAYDEGNGTLLDNSAVLWTNELSEGKDHKYWDIPHVIAGSASGYLKQGQYIKCTSHSQIGGDGLLLDRAASGNPTAPDSGPPGDAPHNKLLTTLLNAVGATQSNGSAYTSFGELGASGEFTMLKA